MPGSARTRSGPLILLGAIVAISGVFSAFLVNDAICLVLAPLVLELTLALGRKPLPYLLAVAMASNVGSTATITGNPQNIMIGSFSHIPYTTIRPGAGAGRAGRADHHRGCCIALCPSRRVRRRRRDWKRRRRRVRANRALVIRALLATADPDRVVFRRPVVPAKAAIIIGGLLLLTRRVKSRRIYAEIDWSLLLMFAGLFIIVAGAQHALLTPTSSPPSAGCISIRFPCSAP